MNFRPIFWRPVDVWFRPLLGDSVLQK
jgi:hypothetical protein